MDEVQRKSVDLMSEYFGLVFANAPAREQANPLTFKAPSKADLAAIQPGVSVKVCVIEFQGSPVGERFWVIVTEVADNTIRGKVANDLTRLPHAWGSPIEFTFDAVFAVSSEEPVVGGAIQMIDPACLRSEPKE